MDDGHVLVIGSAGVDVKGRPFEVARTGMPNTGRVRATVGGVARNIAENLARLEVETVMLTALGKDFNGRRVLRKCDNAGIDMSHVRQVENANTGMYMALLHSENSQLHVGVSDFAIVEKHVDSDYLQENESLFEDAAMVVIDATLSPETLDTLFELISRYDLRVAADPTNPDVAGRLCPYFDRLHLIVPNGPETVAMCAPGDPSADDRESALKAARSFVSQGVDIAVVTLGDQGLAYADGSGGGFLKAIQTKLVDPTGAGDAFTGAAIFGLLNGVPVDEAMRLGATAAALTIESRHTVLPTLAQEKLYARLTV